MDDAMMAHNEDIGANKAATRQIVAMFATGDLTELDRVIAVDYLDHQGLGTGALRGQEGFRRVVMAARAGLPNLHVTIEDLIAEHDKVVVRLRWHSTDPAGIATHRETIDILRFAHGQAVEHWGAVAWSRETRG